MIYVSYYAINDIEELSKELAKQFKHTDKDYNEKEIINKISKEIGLEVKDGIRFQVYFSYEWTDMPIHREMDTMIMSWGGAVYDACDKVYSNKTNVVHYWLENIEQSGKIIKCEYKPTILRQADDGNAIKAEQYFIYEKYICCAIKMRQDYKIAERPLKEMIYTDESVTMNFYLKKMNNMNGVIFYPYYYHVQVDYDNQLDTILSVTASILEGGYATAIYRLSKFSNIELKQKSCGVAPGRKFMHVYK